MGQGMPCIRFDGQRFEVYGCRADKLCSGLQGVLSRSRTLNKNIATSEFLRCLSHYLEWIAQETQHTGQAMTIQVTTRSTLPRLEERHPGASIWNPLKLRTMIFSCSKPQLFYT
ncbi:hypothetical protein PILCRDRAFT_188717 [Piloderma croceum F 1598]|uniref:Uncharacterized protein n=1 Tax=Piloderma croceum (strain F 1598) TaxID=765440 RepID=A0A0C3GFY8_PILCF|nr:hypothetical protein PILCRDRAFT_188717 [Piloderma croceum F 1598]